MRYCIELAYAGTPFCGWQVQPGQRSVQGLLQEVLTRLWDTEVKLTGCGRTDAGVHASTYFAHFDVEQAHRKDFLFIVNEILPAEICIRTIKLVDRGWHARFSATNRTYRYFITSVRDPYRQNFTYTSSSLQNLNLALMNEAANLIRSSKSFAPFCKSGSDADHYQCEVQSIAWHLHQGDLCFEITANRFLRGMVRLIVGASLNIGWNKMTIGSLQDSLACQSPLPHAWSVPARGLFLTDVQYVPAANQLS